LRPSPPPNSNSSFSNPPSNPNPYALRYSPSTQNTPPSNSSPFTNPSSNPFVLRHSPLLSQSPSSQNFSSMSSSPQSNTPPVPLRPSSPVSNLSSVQTPSSFSSSPPNRPLPNAPAGEFFLQPFRKGQSPNNTNTTTSSVNESILSVYNAPSSNNFTSQ
jgi:hypothetical protein